MPQESETNAQGVEVIHSHHIVPVPTYLMTFAALMVLLILTLFAAAFDLGNFNLPIALAIAIAKALLIVFFFMHLKFSSRLVKVFALAALIWLVIMFVLTWADYISRGWLGTPM